MVQFQRGEFGKAADNWNAALAIYRKVYGNDHPTVSVMLNNLGRAELMADHLDAAGQAFERALEIDRRTLSADHDDLITRLNSLAMIDLERGDLTRAGTRLDEALRIARARKHWMLDQVLLNSADLYARENRLSQARQALEEARSAMKAQYGDSLAGMEGWRTAVLGSVEASVTSAAGDMRGAEVSLLAILPVLEARFGANGLYTQQALGRLVQAFERNGRSADAQKFRTRLAPHRRGPASRTPVIRRTS